MQKETLSHERVLDLSAPNEIVVQQTTARRLDELCHEITDTCGQIEAILQLAAENQRGKRATYIKAALKLADRGRRSVKLFLSEWGVLIEESKRENPKPPEPDPVPIPNFASSTI